MKRWFRPIAYGAILALVALAVFGEAPDQGTPAAAIVPAAVAAPPRAEVVAAPRPDAIETSALEARLEDGLAPGLFVAPAPPPPPAPAAPVTPAPEAVPDLKILGWMQSGDVPFVFVQLKGENYTLSPEQAVDGLYRFDRIGDGFADFTYLPTGQARQYAVSNPAAVE